MIFNEKDFLLSSYYYNLPKEKIAQHPLKDRDKSKLLVFNMKTGKVIHTTFQKIDDFFNGNETLVLNNTKVIPARLKGWKEDGGNAEILSLKNIDGYKILGVYKGKIKKGFKFFVDGEGERATLECVDIFQGGMGIFKYEPEREYLNFLQKFGITPLPLYIKRQGREFEIEDRKRYQSIFSEKEGSIAAPTASLHWTDEILERLKKKGVEFVKITLHVGIGTFKPIRSNDIRNHKIDPEYFEISEKSAEIINNCSKEKREIVCCGTTTIRAVEGSFKNGKITKGEGQTDIYIYPSFKFNVVSSLITNFHLPCSSLILLVSAFAGRERILNLYEEAIKMDYRFYSYGDCMFLKG